MRTPKRDSVDYGDAVHGEHGEVTFGDLYAQRWKRKNKERQYKRSITKFVAWARAWKGEAERLERIIHDIDALFEAARPYIDGYTETYGQDIEGS